jgi:hypothetical protein
MMTELDLERDMGDDVVVISDGGEEVLEFDRTPGLTHTKVLAATFNGEQLPDTSWVGVLLHCVRRLREEGLSAERLVSELQVPARVGQFEQHGYKFYRDLGISIQGQSSPDAWREIVRLARKWNWKLRVEVYWPDKSGAQYPGRRGVIRSHPA